MHRDCVEWTQVEEGARSGEAGGHAGSAAAGRVSLLHSRTGTGQTVSDFVARLGRHRIVAVLRAGDPGRLREVTEVLAQCGLALIEFALTTPGALAVLRDSAGTLPDHVQLGAGTVLNAEQVKQVSDAGGSYVVTPCLLTDVIEAAQRLDMPVLSGAYTPTEVLSAYEAGAAAVKVFPASVGGPNYVRLLRDPLPQIPLVPTGGIAIGDALSYITAGALAIGIGGGLVGDALVAGPSDELERRARSLVNLLANGSA